MENASNCQLYKVEEQKKNKGICWVSVRLQGIKARLFADTGCRYTLIPPEM